MTSVLTKKQKKCFRKDYIGSDGRPETIIAEVRHDDSCGNGHNSFAITADVYTQDRHPHEPKVTHKSGKVLWLSSCGCLHDEIAKHFPELAHLIKFHLFDTDNGPMHYVANTCYHASDKDYNGRRAGEPSSWEYGIRFAGVPITHTLKKDFYKFLQEQPGPFAVAEFPYDGKGDYKFDPHYSLTGFGQSWYDCPFKSKTEAEEFCAALNSCAFEFVTIVTGYSKGKPRDLDAARSCAAWPEATDDELMADDLKDRLISRQAGLLAEFRAAVEALGFIY